MWKTAHKQSNMCIPPTHPPTHPWGGWVGEGMKQNFITGITHKQHVLYLPPTHPGVGGWGYQKMENWNCAYLQQNNMF